MRHQYLNDSGDHWAVSATDAIPAVRAPLVLLQLQAQGEQARAALSADQAEAMARELLRRADEVRLAEGLLSVPSAIPAPKSDAPAEPGQHTGERGTRHLQGWSQDGSLLTLSALAQAWDTSVGQLEEALAGGKLFTVPFAGERYVPAGWGYLTQREVSWICSAQKDMLPTVQLLFWKRAHGALGARTPSAALADGDLEHVRQLALNWAVS